MERGSRPRAFVRGAAAVTPLGKTWAESARALAEGASAVRPVTRFDAAGFPCSVAASIDFELDTTGDRELVDRRLAFAIPAAIAAWREASLRVDPARLGVFLGAESGRASWSTVLALVAAAGGASTFDHAAFGRSARSIAAKIDALVVSPSAVASAVAAAIGAEGPIETFSLACASGSAAIAEATRAIRLGQCDAAICGGVGADVDPLMFAAFGLLGALSARGVSMPFDARRDGFVVGEGAAMIVLSSERGPAIAEIAGVGRTLDGHHIVAPDPEGDGAARAMRAALADARAEGVDYIQAHGTSTPLNDAVEAAAIQKVLGTSLEEAKVSSVKGAVGHWIAGAGAVGFLCALEALQTGTLFPTAGLGCPDPACDLPHILGSSIRKDVKTAMVNSFGFGGANCSLIVRRAS